MPKFKETKTYVIQYSIEEHRELIRKLRFIEDCMQYTQPTVASAAEDIIRAKKDLAELTKKMMGEYTAVSKLAEEGC